MCGRVAYHHVAFPRHIVKICEKFVKSERIFLYEPCQKEGETNVGSNEGKKEDAPLVEFMYLLLTRMPGGSFWRWLGSLLCLCDVFWALINSLVCWLSSNESCGMVWIKLQTLVYGILPPGIIGYAINPCFVDAEMAVSFITDHSYYIRCFFYECLHCLHQRK